MNPTAQKPAAPAPANAAERRNYYERIRPLHLTPLWRDHDDPSYAFSWNPDRAAVGAG